MFKKEHKSSICTEDILKFRDILQNIWLFKKSFKAIWVKERLKNCYISEESKETLINKGNMVSWIEWRCRKRALLEKIDEIPIKTVA